MTLTQNYTCAKFDPKAKIFSNFPEIWHKWKIEHANYEYNTRHYLEHSRDYWLTMIIGSEWL